MAPEEAIKEFESVLKWAELNIYPYVSKQRIEATKMAIKSLKQEPILDKIRAEIEALPKTYPFVNHIDMYVKENDVKKIIDKYKAESEG